MREPRHKVSLFVGMGGAEHVPAHTRDISLSGLFLETAQRPDIGELVDLQFVWGDDTFVTKARVVRHADDGVGLTFVEPDPLLLNALTEICGM